LWQSLTERLIKDVAIRILRGGFGHSASRFGGAYA
jgi:hypothetical protein